MAEQSNKAEEFIREITRHQSAMVAYLRLILPRSCDAHDVVQEVNITLWKKRKQYQTGSNFKAWAFKVAKYHALNESRKARNANNLVFDDEIFEDLSANEAITHPLLEDRLSALRICLQKLRPQDRDLLNVRYAGGGSIEQYARKRQQNAGTIRSILKRIRNQLRECISFRMKEKPAG